MGNWNGSWIALTSLALASTPALARDDSGPTPPPGVYQDLIKCRTLTEDADRLRCFDRQTAALEEATQKREIVISDKNAVREARRGLFGFATPIGRIMGFGGNDDDENEIKEVRTTVKSVGRSSSGWRLGFEDGSTWEQNDTRDFVLSPKVGNDVEITRGALGTYLVSVRGQRSIKMRRIS